MKRLHRFAEAVAAGLLAVIFLAFILQVALRYAFNLPVGWTAELSLAAWLWLILWGTAFTLRDEDEIRFEILPALLGPRAQRVAESIGSIAIVTLFAMALPATWDYVTFMKVESTAYMKIRFDWLYSIYIVFAIAVILRHLRRLVQLLRGGAVERSGSASSL